MAVSNGAVFVASAPQDSTTWTLSCNIINYCILNIYCFVCLHKLWIYTDKSSMFHSVFMLSPVSRSSVISAGGQTEAKPKCRYLFCIDCGGVDSIVNNFFLCAHSFQTELRQHWYRSPPSSSLLLLPLLFSVVRTTTPFCNRCTRYYYYHQAR